MNLNNCFADIPKIIAKPDYIGIHPKEKSISFIKNSIPHDTSLESRYEVHRSLRPLWTFTTDRRHTRHTQKSNVRSDTRNMMENFSK